MKNRIIRTVLCASLLAITLAGCTQAKLPVEEQKKFVNEVNNMLADRKPAQDVEMEINGKIKKLDKQYSSDVVNAYIFSLYQENSNMVGKVSMEQGELEELSKRMNIDVTNRQNITQMEEGLVKGLLQELGKRHLLLKKEGKNYYATVDIDYVLSKYGKYMEDDLKSFTEFRQREESTQIFNADNETFDISEIADRAVTIEKELPKWKDSQFKENWTSQQEYYYSILFSLNHQYFKDGDKLNKSVKTKFEEMVKKYPNTQFSKDIKNYLDTVSKAKEKMDESVNKYVLKVMKEKFPHSENPEINPDTTTAVTTQDTKSNSQE